MRSLLGILTFAALAASSSPVLAKSSEPEAQEKDPASTTDYGHAGQFGLRAAVVAGYRMIFRYDDSPFCAELAPSEPLSDAQKVCGHAAPPALDFGLSYALADFVEPFLWLRFGLTDESQTKTDAVRLLGAGVRIYTMSESMLKIFIEPAVGFEFEGGSPEGSWRLNDPRYDRDLVFHVAAGPQLDLAENVGVFVDAGLTIGVLRAVHSSLELAAGLQLRLP